jgi:hypothetical protein
MHSSSVPEEIDFVVSSSPQELTIMFQSHFIDFIFSHFMGEEGRTSKLRTTLRIILLHENQNTHDQYIVTSK